MLRKIAIISFAISILGMISQLLPQSAIRYSGWMNLVYVDSLKSGITFGFNVYQFGLYLFFFFGSLIFWRTNFRESRIVKFMFSMMVFSKILGFLSIIISISSFGAVGIANPIFVISMLVTLGLTFMSFVFLKALQENQQASFVENQYETSSVKIYDDASRGKRLLNYIVDILLIVAFFWPLFELLINTRFFQSIARSMEDILGDRVSVWILYFICSLSYYLFFEGIFGATPGKLLSNTIVTIDDGEKPQFSNIFTRTLSRFVPFEAFSFLMNANWHDRWSQTQVTRLESTGFKTRNYWFAFLGTIAICIFGVFAYNAVEKNISLVEFEREQHAQQDEFNERLNNLDTNNLIRLYDLNYGPEIVLKVEKVNGATVTATMIEEIPTDSVDRNIPQDAYRLEQYYRLHKSKFKQIQIQISALKRGVLAEDDRTSKGFAVPQKTSNYRIAKFFDLYKPDLNIASTDIAIDPEGKQSNDAHYLRLTNSAWTARLIDVKSDDDDAKWSLGYGQLPMPISRNSAQLVIMGKGDVLDAFEVELTFKDTLERTSRYKLSRESNVSQVVISPIK
ncbi:MAG: RDD family protein [Flavobacterium sp.]|uniref:RDD family protein n=1 Tax=Flavobacterium sp. TaxID=239 RepID=UPI0012045AE6|nr:RDD family protein [Flavobacterium sp.]RZJ66467.1 MAG: RDD family protein [Flavobacterium sp.]